MEKVLIAIDYHPISEQVADAAIRLINSMDVQVRLIHVLNDVDYYGAQYPTFMGYDGYTAIGPDYNMAREMRNIAEEFLQKAAEHLDYPGVTTHLAEGETAKVLLNYAEEWNADMIVMGTHSHSTLEKLFIGTVAEKVVEKTKVPVYLVPVNK